MCLKGCVGKLVASSIPEKFQAKQTMEIRAQNIFLSQEKWYNLKD